MRIALIALFFTVLFQAAGFAQAPENPVEVQAKWNWILNGIQKADREILALQTSARPDEQAGLVIARRALIGLIAKIRDEGQLEYNAAVKAAKKQVPKPREAKSRKKEVIGPKKLEE